MQVADFPTRPVGPAVLAADQIVGNLLERLALFHWISDQKRLDCIQTLLQMGFPGRVVGASSGSQQHEFGLYHALSYVLRAHDG